MSMIFTPSCGIETGLWMFLCC